MEKKVYNKNYSSNKFVVIDYKIGGTDEGYLFAIRHNEDKSYAIMAMEKWGWELTSVNLDQVRTISFEKVGPFEEEHA